MINDDKRVLEYCKSLLDYTKGDKNVLISRQNFEYLFNVLNKHFILEAALEKVKETSEDRKLKINRQTKEINRLHEKINELEQSHVDVVNEYKRLEEVIELMCESYHDYLVADNIKRSEVRYKSYLDYKEIIKSEFEKQAERVQELEELTHKQGKVIIKQSDELDIFDQQNKRYREALEEIARSRFPGASYKAREVLKEMEK